MTLTDLKIKRIDAADTQTLLNLGLQTFTEAFAHQNNPEDFRQYLAKAFNFEKIQSEINNQDSEFYFAFFNNEPIGYIKLNFGKAQTELQDEKSIEIERIYVLQSHQGKKTGQFFIDQIVSIAKERKLSYIWLGVWEENKSAIRFYERNGFSVFSNHIYMIGKDKQLDLLMKLELD